MFHAELMGHFAEEIRNTERDAQGYEMTQLRWAGDSLAAAIAESKIATPLLDGKAMAEGIRAADAVAVELGRAVVALSVQPPPRADSRMVYDVRNRKIVLFGGDALDRLLADTWIYDCASRTWEQRRPVLSPSPRAGSRMVYLPRSGKVLIIDGYGYKGSGEMWAYDTAENRWDLLAEPSPPRARRREGLVSASRGGDG